ncbi:hypothetical protein [Streptomyces sp. NPDC051173]|uniref:hypothetical protein n=1 Tax=Streptomyces sp. NPDC051173 TaxID=3155164 RepID=UPI00345078EA
MPDRRLHAAHRFPLSTESNGSAGSTGSTEDSWGAATGNARMAHERPSSPSPDGRPSLEKRPPSSSSGDQPSDDRQDNPFAPPPEGGPDRPWEPREGGGGERGGSESGGEGGDGGDGGKPSAWGSQWSSRQPGPHGGGFGGQRPSGPPSGGPGGGLRWDPTDPAQRRARYALLAGLWGFFFALFSIPQVALLLGALSVYWAISSLRAKPQQKQRTDPDIPPPPPPAPGSPRPQTTAAVSGLVMGGLSLAIVAATFAFQIVYKDYYTCVDDALTQSSRQACESHLPKQLRPLLGAQD